MCLKWTYPQSMFGLKMHFPLEKVNGSSARSTRSHLPLDPPKNLWKKDGFFFSPPKYGWKKPWKMQETLGFPWYLGWTTHLELPRLEPTEFPHSTSFSVTGVVLAFPDAPCREYLPTLGEKWPHSRGNVGKYSLDGSYGIDCWFRLRSVFCGWWKNCRNKSSVCYIYLQFPWFFMVN